MMKIKYAFASVPGKKHSDEGQVSQDYTWAGMLGGKFTAIASDGCGSRQFGREAAELTVKAVQKYLSQSPWDVAGIINAVVKQIYQNAFGSVDIIAEYAATLLVCQMNGTTLNTLQLGDGYIGYKTTDKWQIAKYLHRSEYVNETNYVCDLWNMQKSQWKKFYEEYEVQEVGAFILCTDGFENYCIEKTADKASIYQPFLESNIAALIDMDVEQDEINKRFAEMITNGNEDIAIQEDDKSLIIATMFSA